MIRFAAARARAGPWQEGEISEEHWLSSLGPVEMIEPSGFRKAQVSTMPLPPLLLLHKQSQKPSSSRIPDISFIGLEDAVVLAVENAITPYYIPST